MANRRAQRARHKALLLVVSYWGTLLPSCNALVRVPGGRLDVNSDGVFVNLLGALVRVTDNRVLIDVPGVHVDVRGGCENHHNDWEDDSTWQF